MVLRTHMSRLLKFQSGTRVAELGSPAGLKKKKKTHAVIGHQNFAAAVKKL